MNILNIEENEREAASSDEQVYDIGMVIRIKQRLNFQQCIKHQRR